MRLFKYNNKKNLFMLLKTIKNLKDCLGKKKLQKRKTI